MVGNFEFLQPQYLTWLLLLPIFGILLYISLKLRNQQFKLLTANTNLAHGARFPFIAHLFFLLLLILALARPTSGYKEHTLDYSGSDYVFILDISHSMLAGDISPNRLKAAKRKIIDTLELLQEKSPGARVALVPFAGSAYVFCPLTEDFTAFKIFLDAIQIELIDDPGSDLFNAIKISLNMLAAAQAQSANIIVLSDFEEKEPSDQDLFNLLKNSTHITHLIGFGTVTGGPMRFDNGRFLRDTNGNFVISKLDQARLNSFGKELNGWHAVAQIGSQDIEAIISNSASSGQQQKSLRIYNELGPWLALVALIWLLFIWHKRLPSALFVLTLALLLKPSLNLKAESETQINKPILEHLDRAARKAYQSKDYEKAKTLYMEALAAKPDNRKVLSGLAASEFKLGNTKKAQEIFNDLKNNANNTREEFEALYNIGTSALTGAELDLAITSLEQALELKPDDLPTKTNLEIARALKEKQQQEPQPSPSPSTDESDESNEPKNSEQEQEKNNEDSDQDNNSESSKESEQENEPTQKDEQTDKNQETQSSEQNEENAEDKQDKSQAESENESNSQEEQSQNSASEQTAKELSDAQARAWLESLPDAPVILRRYGENKGRSQSGQTW